MNIDHVTRILGYTGEKGAYYDSTNGNYTPTAEAMTIGDIISKKGEPGLTEVQTPDGKDIKTYLANYYNIYKTDVNKMQKAENINLIYPSNLSIEYWLASPSTTVPFKYGIIDFGVRCVNTVYVSAEGIFGSDGNSRGLTYSLRPVVSLNSNVTLTKDGEGVWNIN